MMNEHTHLYLEAMQAAFDEAVDFLEGLDDQPVGTQFSYEKLKNLWDQELPVKGSEPSGIIRSMSKSARPGLNLNQSGRFFSWVIGGSHPAALAAEWLVTAWDQNAGLYNVSPAASIAEEIAGHWLKQILHVPASASFAFVTGCQMANFTCLNAARNHLYHTVGWDIEKQGFYQAPPIRIITGDQRHSTVDRAIRMLGFGTDNVINLPSNEDGTIVTKAVIELLLEAPEKPTMLILQAGEIHTGAFDDFKTIIPVARQCNAWVHVDGAFGMWVVASRAYRHLAEGIGLADSWATDGHKWLNVPYDSGYAFVARADAHFLSISQQAAYIEQSHSGRDQYNWNPELSRRARGFATYAVIRELGLEGIEKLVDRCCRHAHEIVSAIGQLPNVEVLAAPVINQGIIRFLDPTPGADESDHALFTEMVIDSINATGEALFQPSTFKQKRCMRVSVSGWRTNEEDVRRTISAIEKSLDMMVEKRAAG